MPSVVGSKLFETILNGTTSESEISHFPVVFLSSQPCSFHRVFSRPLIEALTTELIQSTNIGELLAHEVGHAVEKPFVAVSVA